MENRNKPDEQKESEQKVKSKSTKAEEFKAAIEVAEKDYVEVRCNLRENNSDPKAHAKADQILQHVKALYDDVKLPYEYEVRVSDLYEKIKNDIEALDYVKRLGTTVKTRQQVRKKNKKTHNAWVTAGENQRKKRRKELEPLLSAVERGDRKNKGKYKRRPIPAIQLKQVAFQLERVANDKCPSPPPPPSPKDVFDFEDDDSPIKKKSNNKAKTKTRKSPRNRSPTSKTRKSRRKARTTTPTKKETATKTPTRKTKKTATKKTATKKTATKKTTTKKTTTKKTKPSKSGRAARKRANKSIPKRETRDERRKRKQNEVIEQASIFDFGDVEDPYA